jgi:APA family basic amino acid/polyamine antiporter
MSKPRLKREIGLFEATAYGVGIILGAGIYALIGKAAGIAGNAVWLSFLIGAAISSFTGLSYAELSSMFPKAAAEYVYVKKAYDSKLLAFLIGWLIVFTGIVSAATVALGFAGYLNAILGSPIILTAVVLIGSLSFLNFYGIKESARVNILFTFIEILGLILIILMGLTSLGKVNYFEMPHGMSGIFIAAALIFFAYIGFENVVNIAEETKNPTKVIPGALILSIIITTVLYVLVAVSTVSLADWKELGKSTAPLAYAASRVLGKTAFSVISFIALFATTNTVLILLIAVSRMIYGMARDGSLPQVLSSIHEKRRTPWLAVIVTMLLSMFFVLLGDIRLVASITSFGAFITFSLVNLSLIWMRYKKSELRRPFKVPLNIGKFPILGFLGLISCLIMVMHFDLNVILLGTLIMGMGLIVYVFRKEKFCRFN